VRRYLRDPTFSRFDTIPECDRHAHTHTHRQTDRHTTTAYTALSKASRGKNECSQCQCPPLAATPDRNLLQNNTIVSINKLVKQIILYRRQNYLSTRNDVGQLWHVFLTVFRHSIPHMIIHWHNDMKDLLLFLLQSSEALFTCLFS